MEKDEVSNESCNPWKNTAALKELSMFGYIDQSISKAPIQNG